MKLRELPKPEVFKSGVDDNNRKKFSFSNNAKKYRIMSSLIYKYKIRAIIREISTNAIDGHLAAGNNDSFDVHIPSTLEPWFSVRDYGTGLCHEDIESIYTVYFESTKTDDPDAIGALGLGSKSPFCYSEAFTVESVFEGVKRSYVAYLENDEPFIDLVNTSETNEPAGILVKVPVKVEDIKEWEKEAHRIYESFGAIRPNFVGVPLEINYQNNEPDPITGIIKHKSSYSKGLYARMGGIMYPIDQNIYQNTLLSFYMDSSSTYIMEFALGELDFMPSREELSLDRITLAKIKERIEGVNKVYHDELIAEFEQRKTPREKLVFYHNRSHNVSEYMNKQFNASGLFAINGMSPVNAKSQILNLAGYDYLSGVWANQFDSSRACEYQQIGKRGYHRNETQRRMRIERITSPWEQKKLYFVSNIGKGYKKQLVGYCRLNGINTIYCINEPSDMKNYKEFIDHFMFDESEIVHLDISTMTDELEKYKKDFPKSRLSYAGSDRESVRTPTLNRYYIDDSGSVVREDLYYTKQQFIDMPPEYALRVYGIDEYEKLDLNGSSCFEYHRAMQESNWYKLKHIMKIVGITSFVTVRNSLWNRIDDSNVMCLDEKLQNIFIDYTKRLKENEYSTFETLENRNEVTYLKTYFGVGLDKLVKNRYNEPMYMALKFLSCYVRPNIDNKKMIDSLSKFRERDHKMRARVDAAYNKFCELNPAIGEIINAMTYCMNNQVSGFKKPEVVENVNSLIRWK